MQKIWIDCDTGFDDLFAIAALSAAEEIDIVGISTVVGNTSLQWTTSNTLSTVENFHIDAPVYAGCAKPMAQEPCTIESLLGEAGMGTINRPLPAPRTRTAQLEHAVNALLRTLSEHESGEITVLATGPMTNVAVAAIMDPEVFQRIGEIVFMGGSYGFGNHTCAAEFNTFADPEALDTVIRTGVPLRMFGLNVTNQVLITPEHSDRIRNVGSEFAQCVADCLEKYLRIRDPHTPQPMALHDPTAAGWLIFPEFYEFKHGVLSVELNRGIGRGATFCEFRPKRITTANAHVAMRADGEVLADRLVDLVICALTKVKD
ncbi:nucleoside hydrolase [Trueperella sp. LYQ143]|uniref:nucleoside hydrolase n=1 Tax=unclassified Trueperella TaxID=2630174 RepID=UPI0039832DFF